MLFLHVYCAGGISLAEQLIEDPQLSSNKSAMNGLNHIKLLLEYLEIFQILDKVCFFAKIPELFLF